MSFPVSVHQDNGHFVATLIGAPEVRVTAPTRETALEEMRIAVSLRLKCGDLVLLDLEPEGILASAGKYRNDPTLAEIRDEIYRERDAEPKE